MKKTILVILVIAAVAFSAFAGGFHYGIESDVSYEFNLTNDPDLEGTNKAVFKFKPYVYSDFFTVRLLAEWIPDENNAHGFDHLLTFDTTDIYTITASALEYIDTISITTDVLEFEVGKGTREFDIAYDSEVFKNRAQFKANFGLVKVDVYSTDFFKREGYDKYDSMQYADVKVNLGLIEVEASAMRQAFAFFEIINPVYNRIIPKVGAKLQFGLANVGFYLTTDTAYNADNTVKYKLFDRWLLEALAEFKVGSFDLKGTFYLDNRLEGYSSLFFDDKPLYGLRANAHFALGEFLTFDATGDIPLSLDGGITIIRDDENNTTESLSASVEFGTWWKVGAEIAIRGLISQIEKGYDFMKIVDLAEPTITAGIYTVPLDVTASVKLSQKYPGLVPEFTIGAVIRGDNFLAQTK